MVFVSPRNPTGVVSPPQPSPAGAVATVAASPTDGFVGPSQAGFESRLRSVPPSKWSKVIDEPNLAVAKASLPGVSVDAVQLMTTIDAPIDTVFAVMMAQDRAVEWVPNVGESKLLAKNGRDEIIAYSRTPSPVFLVADREVIMRGRARVIAAKKQFEIVSTDVPNHPKAPKRRGVVRVRDAEIRTVLTKVGPSKTHVMQQILLEPGGSIPSWIINAASTDAPRKTAKNLAKQVKDPSYAEAAANVRAAWPELAGF